MNTTSVLAGLFAVSNFCEFFVIPRPGNPVNFEDYKNGIVIFSELIIGRLAIIVFSSRSGGLIKGIVI